MNRNILGAAFALAILSGAPAFAAPEGYVTGTIGSTQYDIDCAPGVDCDKSGVSGRVIGGWEFAPTFAAELSYANLGEATIAGSDKVKGSFIGVGAAWRPSFGHQWGGVARAGVAFVTTKAEAPGFTTFSHDSTQAYIGLGVTYALSRQWSLEADWNHVKLSLGDQDGASGSTNSFEAGGTLRF